MEKLEKIKKMSKQYAVVCIILLTIMLITSFMMGFDLIYNIMDIVALLLLIGFYKGIHDMKLYGSVCGIVVAVLLFISRDIINILLGIFLLIDSIQWIKLLNSSQNT